MFFDEYMDEYYAVDILRLTHPDTGDVQLSRYIDLDEVKAYGIKVDKRCPNDVFNKVCEYLNEHDYNTDEAKLDWLHQYKPASDVLLAYRLIKTNKRLTFDIGYQSPKVTETQSGDENRTYFKASNGVEVISCSRMDLHSQKVWLHGAERDQCADRSGSLVFPNNEKRDKEYDQFIVAINEWAIHNGGVALLRD